MVHPADGPLDRNTARFSVLLMVSPQQLLAAPTQPTPNQPPVFFFSKRQRNGVDRCTFLLLCFVTFSFFFFFRRTRPALIKERGSTSREEAVDVFRDRTHCKIRIASQVEQEQQDEKAHLRYMYSHNSCIIQEGYFI